MKTLSVSAPQPVSTEPLDLAESVAGEEDPGASLDVPMTEDLCPRCGGSGKLAGRDCPECQGTGKVTVGIGGA